MDLLLIIFLTLLNALFAMSELAVVSSRRIRLEAMGKNGDRRTAAALKLLEKPTQFLSTVQVGITSIGMLNGIVGEAAFSEILAEQLTRWGISASAAAILATAIVIIAITFITIIFGELVPKRIGQMYPESVARWVAQPMAWLSMLTKPFVGLLSISTQGVLKLLHIQEHGSRAVTEEEISASLEEGVDAGLIEAHEHQMLRNVFNLDDRALTSIMVPRGDIDWMDANLSVAEAIQYTSRQGKGHAHSWYPVCRAGLDNVVGIVSVAKLLELGMDCSDPLPSHTTPAEFVPETLSGMEMLERWRSKSGRLLLVVDEYGVIQGLLTPRDLLEAITGELKSTTPIDAWATPLAGGRWSFDGAIPINELKSRLDIDELPQEDRGRYNTLAGLLMFIAGRLPLVNEQIECAGWIFTINAMEGHRIDVVSATRQFKKQNSDNDETSG